MGMPSLLGSDFSIVLQILIDSLMISFCFFSLIILVYYIRRRYHLYLQIKAITAEQLWFRSFQNHLKNLKIKALIANFVMIILLVEIGTRVTIIYNSRCFYYQLLQLSMSSCPAKGALSEINITLEMISLSSYIPLVSLFVKVLWLVYLHSPYKYSVMKWVGYIVMKIITTYMCILIEPIISQIMYGYDEEKANEAIFSLLPAFFLPFEYIYYLIYSRRFYLLLKGIELENKLSLDREKYLESKFVRIHFKVCTILIAIAFFFRIISGLEFLQPFIVEFVVQFLPGQKMSHGWRIFFDYLSYMRLVNLGVYRFISNLNYLYMFFVILLQYRKKRNNRNINDRIRPLVRAYQDRIFTPRVYYTRC